MLMYQDARGMQDSHSDHVMLYTLFFGFSLGFGFFVVGFWWWCVFFFSVQINTRELRR